MTAQKSSGADFKPSFFWLPSVCQNLAPPAASLCDLDHPVAGRDLTGTTRKENQQQAVNSCSQKGQCWTGKITESLISHKYCVPNLYTSIDLNSNAYGPFFQKGV